MRRTLAITLVSVAAVVIAGAGFAVAANSGPPSSVGHKVAVEPISASPAPMSPGVETPTPTPSPSSSDDPEHVYPTEPQYVGDDDSGKGSGSDGSDDSSGGSDNSGKGSDDSGPDDSDDLDDPDDSKSDD